MAKKEVKKSQENSAKFSGVFWIGQVPLLGQDKNKSHPAKWGDRVQVRIMGLDIKDGRKLPDADLPMALILKPTSQGNFNRGSIGIMGGEWVYGTFIPPKNERLILGVFGRSDPRFEITDSDELNSQSTEFRTVKPHTAAWNPGTLHQVLGRGPGLPGQGPHNNFDKPTKGEWESYTKTYDNTAPSGQGAGPMASDIRLKENLVMVGQSLSGLNIYEWNYIWGSSRYRGVIAQEVLKIVPEAVKIMQNGFLAVYYDLIDVNMEKLAK